VVRKALVRAAGVIARPALRFNHDRMMHDGERGLAPGIWNSSLSGQPSAAGMASSIAAAQNHQPCWNAAWASP